MDLNGFEWKSLRLTDSINHATDHVLIRRCSSSKAIRRDVSDEMCD